MAGKEGVLTIPTAAVFEPLLAPARYKGAFGGRGSAKSHFFAEGMVELALRVPGFRGVCIREVQKSLRESAKLLIEDKIQKFGVGQRFQCQADLTKTPGGGLIIYRGMQDYNAESIKSLEGFDVCWNEEAQTTSQRSLELLRPTIRGSGRMPSELWFSWNPRSPSDPVDKFFRGGTPPPDGVCVRTSWKDNPFWPAELETERMFDYVTNPQRYAHIWEGEYEPAVVGSIWTREMINEHRRAEAPTLTRILVSVDPAISAQDGANEHGILVGGLGEDDRGYVLEDATTRGGPSDWASRAVAMFDKHDADAVVVERNQGGDMVRHTLQTERPNLPIIEVIATRGKHVRAEPIAALYRLGRVSHIGVFRELEDQMCMMTAAGYEGPKGTSPDRADAMVWLLTELFPAITQKADRVPISRTWDDVYEDALL